MFKWHVLINITAIDQYLCNVRTRTCMKHFQRKQNVFNCSLFSPKITFFCPKQRMEKRVNLIYEVCIKRQWKSVPDSLHKIQAVNICFRVAFLTVNRTFYETEYTRSLYAHNIAFQTCVEEKFP